MATLSELFSAAVIAAYYTEAGSNRIPYLGEALFPAKKKNGLGLRWIKSHSGLPVSLTVSEFDSKTVIRSREGFDVTETQMPFFREGISIREADRQELLKAMDLGNTYLNSVLSKLYDDAANLIAGANVVNERMRMQLLSTGTIALVDRKGGAINYDYQFDANHKETLTGTNKWSDPDAPVNSQIEGWIDTIQSDTGERPSRAILTTTTLNYLKKNKEVLAELKPLVASQAAPIRTDSIINWLGEAFQLEVAVYNKMYANEVGGAGTKFFPDNVFTLIPAGDLGNQWFGTTPEEADLLASRNANVQIVDTGVAVTTFETADPVNVNTKVSEISLPSFEAADKVFIATVA